MRLARPFAWLAIAAVVVAAAEPSIQTAPRERVGILELVVDRSGSTAAGDLAPTRLDAIRQATLALLDRVPARVRVGLVAFSDKPETLASPTTDRDAVRASLASLRPGGGTAVGDALRRALHDVQAASGAGSRSASPAAPAAVLLLSDGASSTGSSPFDAAREAAARRTPVFAVAVGTPGGMLIRRDLDGVRYQYVPPNPALLRAIAGPTGGRALEARSTPALHAALEDLGRDAGAAGEPKELTLLFAAAALLLLAAGSAMPSRRRAPASGDRARLPAAVRRLAPSLALLVAAGGAAVAWAQLPPAGPGPPPPGPPATGPAALTARAAPSRPPPPFVTVDAAGRDRPMVQQAVALLRRHRELAHQRLAEIDRRGRYRVQELHVSACDVCRGESLTATPTIGLASGRTVVCNTKLNTPVLRKTARRAHVPTGSLAAMVILYEQELCVHGRGEGSPFAAGLRLARKLRDGRLLDLLYAQIDAGRASDWLVVERGVALLRRHGELGAQRWEQLGRQGRNQVWPLRIRVCRGCLPDRQGQARTIPVDADTVDCDIRVDLAVVERAARGWGLPLTQLVASILAHEQGHCIHHPDDRETPAIDEERRLARKLGSARHLDYVASEYSRLDRSGHWKS